MSGKAKERSRQKLQLETKIVNKWGCQGGADGEFNMPFAIAVADNGTIYVADSNNFRIQCFNSKGQFIGKWGRRGSGDGEFLTIKGLAVGILEETRSRTCGVSSHIKREINSVPELASLPPGLLPICMAYLGVERIYVVEDMNNRVQVFDASYLQTNGVGSGDELSSVGSGDESSDVKFICKWGRKGDGNGEFRLPKSCAIGRDAASGSSVVYVSDTGNNRIQVFDGEGKFIRKWGTVGGDDYQFRLPMGLSLSRSGLVYIADSNNNRVVCYHGDGRIAHQWKVDTGLYRPVTVVVDKSSDGGDILYVSDLYNHCIRKFKSSDLNGNELIYTHANGSEGEYGMAIGGESLLYVADIKNHEIIVMKF